MVIYGATLVAFGDQKRGIYRVQSSFWREAKITANKELDEKALQEQLFNQLPENMKTPEFRQT